MAKRNESIRRSRHTYEEPSTSTWTTGLSYYPPPSSPTTTAEHPLQVLRHSMPTTVSTLHTGTRLRNQKATQTHGYMRTGQKKYTILWLKTSRKLGSKQRSMPTLNDLTRLHSKKATSSGSTERIYGPNDQRRNWTISIMDHLK